MHGFLLKLFFHYTKNVFSKYLEHKLQACKNIQWSYETKVDFSVGELFDPTVSDLEKMEKNVGFLGLNVCHH